jgi:hypothetical protein
MGEEKVSPIVWHRNAECLSVDEVLNSTEMSLTHLHFCLVRMNIKRLLLTGSQKAWKPLLMENMMPSSLEQA